MNDKQIRDKFFDYLKSRKLNMRIFQEQSIGSSRCDFMVVTDTVTGYEIKSDHDSYARLESQIQDYDKYFAFNYIIVGKSHINSVSQHVPEHWGIYYCNDKGVRLVRRAKKSPYIKDIYRLDWFLWLKELKNIADRHGIPIRKRDKSSIASEIVKHLNEKSVDRELAFELEQREYGDYYNSTDYTIRIGNKKTLADLSKPRRIECLFNDNGYSEMNNEELDQLIQGLIDLKKQRSTRKSAKTIKVKKELPNDYVNPYMIQDLGDDKTYSIQDAFTHCLSKLGRVDIEYISAVSGSDIVKCISILRDVIIQDPLEWDELIYKGWKTKDEYLSGNMLEKYEIAKRENKKYKGYFQRNMEEIRKVIPNKIYYENIYYTLGSPFVSETIVESFLDHIMGHYSFDICSVKYDEETGRWKTYNKGILKHSHKANKLYGTSSLTAIDIFDRTLNLRPIEVFRKNGEKKELDEEETAYAVAKANALINDFREYVNANKEFRKSITERYNDLYGYNSRRLFDGSFLELLDLNPNISLYKYQKNAVARIILTRNTLLCHEVGSGKTYIMIAAGHELKRMGLSRKNMYVVPNNILGQWENMYREMYYDASIIIIDSKNFSNDILDFVRRTDFEAVIIASSCFDKIPVYRTDHFVDAQENNICFQDLGITRLFVDESHYYKNLGIGRQLTGILGINVKGSKRAKHMLQITDYLNSFDDRGIIFATATPITNTIVEAYAVQKYLQKFDLEKRRINNFTAWIRTFAEPQADIEVDVDTSLYRNAVRFSKFHNMREFTSIFSIVADFHEADISNSIPDYDGPDETYIECSEELKKYLVGISERVETIRSGNVSRRQDNMLKVTTDGRKAALDLRLIDENVFVEDNKVTCCAEKIKEIYDKTANERSTQIVFCDQSVPKIKFNIYDEIKRILIDKGIPQNEIAFIHDAEDDRQRLELFRQVNEGAVRVLIGSSIKLGTGVNIQKKLIAAHHMDVPWRPADMTQREGRIIRQGNENKKVFIYRYITKKSFDAYSWQLLEKKQHFIKELLKGSWSDKDIEDIENTVLTYSEVKALAVGSSLLKKRFELANELKRYKVIQKKAKEERINLNKEADEIPKELKRYEERLTKTIADINEFNINKERYEMIITQEKRNEYRNLLSEGIKRYCFSVSDINLFKYKGFSVIIPANTDSADVYVILERENRYYVKLGSSSTGNLIRIDNYINNLKDVAVEIEKHIRELQENKNAIANRLSIDEDYSDEIDKLWAEIKVIDDKLQPVI